MLSTVQQILPAIRVAGDQAAKGHYPSNMLSGLWTSDTAAEVAPYIWRAAGVPDRILLYIPRLTSDGVNQARLEPGLQTLTNTLVVAPDYDATIPNTLAMSSDTGIERIAAILRTVKYKTGLQRVYIMATSAGTLSAMGLIARYPGLVHRATLWVPICDLQKWYEEAGPEDTYQANLIAEFGHPPIGDEDPDYRYRSPRGRIRDSDDFDANVCTIFLNSGTNDPTVPLHHAQDIREELVDADYPSKLVVACEWNMGHELRFTDALRQLTRE
jgi:pimeloyl-ACP methyl ester carboxylesterase